MTDLTLKGFHHLTAVTARARENLRFYTGVMGMRLVKRTVNQDDVSAYHLFYADAVGNPGTDLTFFDWPAAREKRGTRSVVRTGLRVHGEASLAWWQERLEAEGLVVGEIRERAGRAVLDFEDPEGQRLSLQDDGGRGDDPEPWGESPVPPEHQVRGLGPVVMSVPRLEDTEWFLARVFRMEQDREYVEEGDPPVRIHVFRMDGEGPHAELHVAVEPHLTAHRLGAGGVHHVAFRTPDEAQYDAWAERLNRLRVPNSGKVDRFYFRSLYSREPGGVLFEIATDGPGFAVDEDPDTLGASVALPPFLENRREAIEAGLKPID
jgi:glyoxalase family protein